MFFDPSYVPMHFFDAAPGCACAIEKFCFARFAFFTSKWNYCRVTGPQNKIFINNQLTLFSFDNILLINGIKIIIKKVFWFTKLMQYSVTWVTAKHICNLSRKEIRYSNELTSYAAPGAVSWSTSKIWKYFKMSSFSAASAFSRAAGLDLLSDQDLDLEDRIRV
jgi:hypothetical protein